MSEAHGLRADAEERRRRILAAAYEVFSEQGIDAPMERIAKAAGVGVGTLYRRFPDRTALVIAVIEGNLEGLLAAARAAFDGRPSAWDVIVDVLENPVQMLTMRPQLAQAPAIAKAVRNDRGLRALQGELLAVLARAVDAAQAEGSLRSDVGVADVALLFAAVRRPVAVPGGVADAAAVRLRALALDALSTRPRTALAGEPLGIDALGVFGSR